jgi:hypothetical protein
MITLLATFLVNRYSWDFEDTKVWIVRIIKVSLIFIGIVGFITGGLLIKRAWTNYQIRQAEETLAPVDKAVQDGRIGQDVSNVEKPKQEAVNASKQSNEALENVNKARTVDSNSYDPGVESARRRFCESYPTDSRCK